MYYAIQRKIGKRWATMDLLTVRSIAIGNAQTSDELAKRVFKDKSKLRVIEVTTGELVWTNK